MSGAATAHITDPAELVIACDGLADALGPRWPWREYTDPASSDRVMSLEPGSCESLAASISAACLCWLAERADDPAIGGLGPMGMVTARQDNGVWNVESASGMVLGQGATLTHAFAAAVRASVFPGPRVFPPG